MTICPKCKSGIGVMAIRCGECNYDFPESGFSQVGEVGSASGSTLVGDSILMGGAIACGGLGLYLGVYSLQAFFQRELLVGLVLGPAAIAVCSALIVTFSRAAN